MEILFYPEVLQRLIDAQKEELRKPFEKRNYERLDDLERLLIIAEHTEIVLAIPWTCPEKLKIQNQQKQIWERKKFEWNSRFNTENSSTQQSSPSMSTQSLMPSLEAASSPVQSTLNSMPQLMVVERRNSPQFSMTSPVREHRCQPDRYFQQDPQKVNIFLDLSNISISATRIDPLQVPKFSGNNRIRVKYDILHQVILGDRHRSHLVAVGSYPTGHSYVVSNYNCLISLGYSTKFFSRNCEEHGVDDFILASIRERIKSRPSGEKIVIVTGDGNLNHGKDTFPKVIQSALNQGWEVEVWAWYHGCNSWYKSLEDDSSYYRQYSQIKSLPPNTDILIPQKYGLRSLVELSRFQLHYLDNYREYIT